MKKNLSPADRVVRALAAAAVGVLWGAGVLKGWPAVVLGLVAVVLLATAALGVCPLYALIGVTTKKAGRAA